MSSGRLGILSDSHGHAERTDRAVEALAAAGADRLVHLGDVGTTNVLESMAGQVANVVFGNCDYDTSDLERTARHLGLVVDHPLGRLELAGRTIAFTHGDREALMREAIEDGVDYLLVGHTHEITDRRIDRTRVINPGALFRAARYTAALLDPATDTVEWIEIPA